MKSYPSTHFLLLIQGWITRAAVNATLQAVNLGEHQGVPKPTKRCNLCNLTCLPQGLLPVGHAWKPQLGGTQKEQVPELP